MANSADILMLQAQSQSAKNQMKFQERMSNTAHQREVKDLQAAGLNPVLSSGGSGASTPNGAEGDISGLDINKLLGTLNSSVVSSGKALQKTADTLEKTVENMDKPTNAGNADFHSSGDMSGSTISVPQAYTVERPSSAVADAITSIGKAVPYRYRAIFDQAANLVNAWNNRMYDLAVGTSASRYLGADYVANGNTVFVPDFLNPNSHLYVGSSSARSQSSRAAAAAAAAAADKRNDYWKKSYYSFWRNFDANNFG